MFPSPHIKKPSICSFDSKEKFATNLKLALERNQIRILKQCKAPPERKGWMCQPPDFSYKVHLSSRKPVGKFQELKKKEKKKTFFEELHRIRSGLIVPEDNLGQTEEDKQTKIVTKFPYTSSCKAKLMFVKMGKFTCNTYQDPKPYDYRQYEKGIPDFVTSYARDPLNLKFKSQCLSKIYGLPPLKDKKTQSSSKERFITHKPQELKWDSKLFLPKEPWPTKACSFTRHRNRWGAPIDRVEETLSKLWLKEAIKNQKEIRRKTAANIKQKLPSIPVSIRKQQLTGRKEEKSLSKTLHSPSLSLGQCEWSMPKDMSLVKPEPLGFLLPTGIAQTVEELKYE